MSQLVNWPKGLEALLGAKRANIQGSFVALAGGANQLSGLVIALGVGTLDTLFGRVVSHLVGKLKVN